ncbi:hypothetical protein SAMN05444008_10993 [Cnuella takakiae]|uniref:Uncharacterized protein n=1 Tax=Cnuella takakiae TaxID=1302690 RepID=A0A1M5CIX2_9BACT|nr:hypothetical protein BUE76_07960 [Cnuella takakiae]SHF54631.1 hypothetical protein SAMN05444008_10993 [Cnuella takakiae]
MLYKSNRVVQISNTKIHRQSSAASSPIHISNTPALQHCSNRKKNHGRNKAEVIMHITGNLISG